LIHNDYKYDNLVLAPNDLAIRAVLDWEMATIGDPLMDLGTSLGYWVEENDPEEWRAMAFCLTMWPGNCTRPEIVERYARVSGRDVSRIQFYYVYALFKIAVIVQQIYNRYQQGHSRDERFANLINAVRVLGRTAARVLEARTPFS
jgi:aminoglycoside phosphotransferase (APT) family kinase protein